MVLEDMDNAVKRNAAIYAEYLGGGFDMEGWKITMPQLGSSSYQNAIRKAFKQADISGEDVGLLCPHGTGCSVIDYYEASAIKDIFGKRRSWPVITAFKPYIGHTLGASALLETAILLLALKNSTVPPTLNHDDPDPRCGISLATKRVDTDASLAVKTCSAFAGFNSAAVFKKVD
jgi:3-oxoacyl-[acyl-carrier-protein] synthase II